jgi:phospholipid transport system substrate-binding protein
MPPKVAWEAAVMVYNLGLWRLTAWLAAAGVFLSLSNALAAQPSAQAAAPASVMVTVGDPMTATRAMVGGALDVLRDPHLPLNEKRDRLRALAESHLDFDSMAHATLGHHWSELNPEQRARFTRELRSFIENAYLSKIQDYSGQKVIFIREKLDGGTDGVVYSQWVGGGDEPVKLQFMLHRNNGEWQIYDLVADGVGVISNYRAQFSRVLDNHSFDTLINLLKLKDQQLAARLGK